METPNFVTEIAAFSVIQTVNFEKIKVYNKICTQEISIY